MDNSKEMALQWLKGLSQQEKADTANTATEKPEQAATVQAKPSVSLTPEQTKQGALAWLSGLRAEDAYAKENPYYGYQRLTKAADFAEKSKYVSTANGTERTFFDLLFDNYDPERSGWDDPLYEHINGNEDASAWISNAAAAGYGDGLGAIYGRKTENKNEAQQMTAEEISIFNYLYATQGKEAAHEFYEYLESDLYARDRKASEAYWAQYAKDDPFGSSVFSAVTSPLKGLSYLGQASDMLTNGSVDENAPYNSFVYENNAIRSQVAKSIEESGKWGAVGSFAYQTAMSMADFLTTTAVSGGNGALSMLIMGSGAAANTTIAAKDRGLSDGQAFTLGTIAGLAEAVTERFSLEALLKPDMSKTAVEYILKNVLTEATEEGASTLINTMADVIISQDQSEWARSIQAYRDSGKSEAEAFGLALADQAASLGLDMLGGAISGGFMGTGGAVANYGGSHNQNVQQVQDSQSTTQGGENVPQVQTPAAGKSPAVSTPVAGQTAQVQSPASAMGSLSAIGIRDQIRETQETLNAMPSAADIQVPAEYSKMDIASKKNWVVEKLRPTGYKVERKGFGIIDFAKKRLKSAFNYFNKDSAEEAAFEALPYVLEKGVEITSRESHKDREYGTVTIAAPITLNGKRGNMAVVVKQTDGNHYKVHRILTPDGSVFILPEMTNEAESTPAGESPKNGSLATPKDPASNNNIAQGVPGVNRNESVGAADANFTGKQAYYDLLTDDNVKPGRPGDVRNVEVPETDGYGRRVSDSVTNAVGAEVTTDEMAGAIEELIGEGALGFDVKSDKSLFDAAAKDIKEHGAASTMHDITTRAMKGNAKDSDIVKALLLYNIYNQKKDIDRASEIMVDLATMANDAGRKLRLFGLLRKMTPEGQAAVVRKTVERAVKRLNEGRSNKNQAEVTIPQELMDAYTEAARRDSYEHSEESEQAKVEAEQAIYKAAAAQIQASPMEKLNAWRYMAMLGNAKTQLRNFAGNALFRPLVSIKRAVGAAIESVTLEQKDRTKAVLGRGEDAKALVSWAQEDASSKTAEELLSYCAQTGDAARNAIDENRQIFETKWLESVREFVKKVPEGADMLFKKREYTLSLTSFLKARGYTAADIQAGKVSQDALNEGRAYAAQEALKATFNDHNFLSDGLAKMRYKGNHWAGQLFNMLGEGVMPFRRTPANIVVRGLEYGPVGLAQGIWNAAVNVRSGKVSAATAIDQIAGGLTGMGMMALGWALASGVFGIRLRGTVDEEEKLSGHQSYALEIGDQSYDISWLAPANIPLLVGANLCENSADGENWLLSLADSTVTALEPMLELSCLSSLNDLIRSAQYAEDGEWLYALVANGATSYLNQFIPTILGQAEQAFEGEKKSVYSNADTALERNVEKTIGRITQKIPGIDLFQTEKVDKWGRTQEQNPVEQVFNAFINPSKVTTVEETEADRELERLRNAVPDENVYPGSFRKKISYTDSSGKTQKKELTAEEYATLAKAQGQQSRELVEEIIGMDDYKSLTDAEKAKVIRGIYEYSAAVSKSAVIEGYHEEPPYITNRAKGMSVAEAIIRQTMVGTTKMYTDLPLKQAVYIAGVFDLLEKEKKADGTEYASVRTVQKVEALAGSNLSEKQQEDVMDDILDDGAYEKYVKILAAGYDTDDYAAAYRLYQDTEKSKYANKKDTIINAFVKELGITRNAAKTLYDIYAGKDD